MRPFGHAHRPRRDLVSRGQPHPAPGDGPPVLDGPQARARREPCPCDASRKARHRRRVHRLPRGRDEQSRPKDVARASPSAWTAATLSSSAPTIRSASSRPNPVPLRASLVRHGLEAELTRAVYYELAELALAGGDNPARRVEQRRLLPAGPRMTLANRLRDALAVPAVEPPLVGDLPEIRAEARCACGGAGRDHGTARAGSDPDRPPRAYAHPRRPGRLPGRPHRSWRGCDRRGTPRGA